MYAHCRWGLIASLLVLVAAWGGNARAGEPRVVIISLDGFASYLLDDPKAPVPTLRRLARDGGHAPAGMKVSNPSVTWPNHTTLVTGVRPEQHGVLANGVLVRGAPGVPIVTDPRQDKQAMVQVPTLFDVAHAAGLSTGEINWPCTRGAPSLDDSFPDAPDAVLHSTPRLRSELIAAGLLPDDTDASFRALSVVARDWIWTEAACHLLRTRRPRLLLLHLLNCDATHHALGAQSPAGYTANAYADACVARLLATLDETGLRADTTVFIVADHGFALTPKAVRPNVLLRQAGLLAINPQGTIVEARVQVVPEGGTGLVYCTDPGRVEEDRRRTRELFADKEGIAALLGPEEFAKHGMPHPRAYRQAPDLVLVTSPGYAVSGQAQGEELIVSQVEGRVSLGSHGLIADESKMNALCIISGRGVAPGTKWERVENVDIAPTAARLLNLQPFPALGRSLIE